MIKMVRIIAVLFGNQFNELAHTPKGIWSTIQIRLQFSMLGLVAHGGILPYESRTDMNACRRGAISNKNPKLDSQYDKPEEDQAP